MKVKIGDEVELRMLDNLMKAHEKAAESGKSANEIIKLTKFILKLRKKMSQEVFEIGLEEEKGSYKNPPNKG